jgi:hypothetical protein
MSTDAAVTVRRGWASGSVHDFAEMSAWVNLVKGISKSLSWDNTGGDVLGPKPVSEG